MEKLQSANLVCIELQVHARCEVISSAEVYHDVYLNM